MDVAKAGPAPKSMQWSMLWEIRSAFTSRQDLPVTQDGADVLLPDLRADTLLADKGYDAGARVIDVLLHKIDIKRTRLTSRTLKTYFLCLRRESAPSTQQALIQD